MLTQTDLPEEPVVFAVRNTDGHAHDVRATRRPGGAVSITCSCAMFAREAWCRHVVDVMCMRLRALGVSDEGVELALEAVVMGTKAEDLAHEVDRALIAYERALARFDQGRSGVLGLDVVETMGTSARDVAEAATTLADAIGRFKRTLASASADASV